MGALENYMPHKSQNRDKKINQLLDDLITVFKDSPEAYLFKSNEL